MIVQVTLRAEAAEKATADVRAELETALKALAVAQNKPKEHAMRFPKPRKTDDKIGMGDIIACLELVPDLLPDSEDDDVESKADGAIPILALHAGALHCGPT
ncbi:hypothetical protein PENSPDRAFT_646554 [Peniophora sp. CONT]|nr:hypothetical protein PENSPDRAFT_646554 [Peniophora sp. CONT]